MTIDLDDWPWFSETLLAHSFPGGHHATSIVEGVGMFLFALYHVIVIIVLVNMLIAMMSHSFEDIQVSTLEIYILCYFVTIFWDMPVSLFDTLYE